MKKNQKRKMKNLPGRFKRLLKPAEQPVAENATCKNCETVFTGRFCPECGQSVNDFDKPFGFIVVNFLGDFFAFDTRYFRTFVQLVFSPGKLTNEFFAGKRVSYAPPIRIFIFMSFVLFLLLQIYTTQQLTSVLDSSPTDNNAAIRGSSPASLKDSLIADIVIDTGNAPDNFPVVRDTARSTTRGVRLQLNEIADVIEKELENSDKIPDKTEKNIVRLLRSPEQAIAEILRLLSWAFFLLLPVFALLLKLVYIRRKYNYIRYLIYSIHFHSFIFFDLIILVSLAMIFGSVPGWFASAIFLLIPVYFIASLKKVYGQSLGKVIVKFLIISALYYFIFLVMIIGVLVLLWVI